MQHQGASVYEDRLEKDDRKIWVCENDIFILSPFCSLGWPALTHPENSKSESAQMVVRRSGKAD